MLQLPVYLDHNSTTPWDPRVVEAMLPYFTTIFGNAASRSHAFGWEAEEAVELAREQVAHLIGAGPKEIVFTSGATEGDNLAIKGVFEMYAGKGNHVITVATEHKAVLDTCHHLEKLGAEVSYLPVQPDGLIDPEVLQSAIRADTILIDDGAAGEDQVIGFGHLGIPVIAALPLLTRGLTCRGGTWQGVSCAPLFYPNAPSSALPARTPRTSCRDW